MELALKALADKNRRRILGLLRKGPLSVGEVALKLEIKQSSLSSHLRILHQSGLVERLVAGRMRIYNIDKDQIKNLIINLRKLIDDGDIEEIKVRHSRI